MLDGRVLLHVRVGARPPQRDPQLGRRFHRRQAVSMELLDAQMRWLLRHGYVTWQCYRCKKKLSSHIGIYYHLVDWHGLDPQSAFREGEAGERMITDEPRRLF
jgi:hypothetical protein